MGNSYHTLMSIKYLVPYMVQMNFRLETTNKLCLECNYEIDNGCLVNN